MNPNHNSKHLDALESEAIYIMREAVAEFKNPAILFSGGKDSITLVHLAEKAFYPEKIPFKLVHIDTGHNFPETLEFRDKLVSEKKANLIIGYVEEAIQSGRAQEEKGKVPSRNSFQSITLLETIEKYKFDACIGGARRDEEKARAKERFFSIRNEFGEWDPKLQRPEIWNLYNTKIHLEENVRIFPLSNWTEIDVWQYIAREKIELPNLYFSHQRDCVFLDGIWLPISPFLNLEQDDRVEQKTIRFRTIGDMTCTAAIESSVNNVDDIVIEISNIKTTERGTRMDDKRSETAMEDRKKQGYF